MSTPTLNPLHRTARIARLLAATVALVALPIQLTVAAAQSTTPAPNPPASTPHPPAPTQIAAAHKIFLTNAGAAPNFPIDQARAYESIYAALQSWGKFQLVPSADEADLVFSLHDVAPITNLVGDANGGTYSLNTPAFQLSIIDPHTQAHLWTITSPVLLDGRGKTYDRWVAISITNLVSRLKVLSGASLNAAESDDLTTYPRSRGGVAALWIVGGTVALGAVGGLILHHEFENSLADQKTSQDKFCEHNNIPLSECAGG
jgi:hypothetical protein